MEPKEPLVAAQDDIGLLALVIANGFTDAVLERLAAKGFGEAKFGHGFIVQGLLAGDTTVTELAERLGITVQAVSKTVLEMEQFGYIERTRSAADGRAWTLALSKRGQASVAESRRARFAVMRDLEKKLGKKQTREAIRALRAVADQFGGLEALATRRLRPRA
jgi:DNA-binding MarR family transcriptional regulator